MPPEHHVTLRTAEKLLRVGKIAAAISEYTKAVRQAPHDWDTAILLASLHARNGDLPAAVEQYRGVAASLTKEGHHSRAANVLERVLALRPGDEDTLEQLAEASAANGDIAAACSHLMRIADRRISRSDFSSAIDALERAAILDPDGSGASARLFELCIKTSDFSRARTYVTTARDCRVLATALQQAGRDTEALDLLRDAFRRDPNDVGAAATLARTFLRQGSIDQAVEFLTPAIVGPDPAVRAAAIDLFLHTGRRAVATQWATQMIGESKDGADRIAELACSLADEMPEAAFEIAELALTRWLEQSAWDSAIATLELFTAAVPNFPPALIRLIEVAVDADRLDVADRSQEMLANAYLAQGDVSDALAIAHDLFERDPRNARYEALLQRARQMSRSAQKGGETAEVVPMRAAR